GLKRKNSDKPRSNRKINPDLVREAILAIGSSAPRKGYKAYYDYYMELEKEKRPDFKHSFNNFMKWCDRIIRGDRKIQAYLKKGKNGLLQRYPVGVRPKSYLNEEWQVDSTKMDFMVKISDPSAKKGYRVARKNLSAVIDTCSGAAYAELIDTNNSNAQVRVLFNAMNRMGIPDKVRCDNGTDYASKHYQNFLHSCKIACHKTLPFEGRQKGTIERFFGVIQGALAWLPGYIGNDLTKRTQIENQHASTAETLSGKATRIDENKLLFEDELQALIDDELKKRYCDYRAHAPVMASVQELAKIRAFLGKQHHRTLQAYGVDLNGKTYQSAQFWDKCEIGDSLIVVESPDNPNEVDIYTPLMKYLTKATCTDLGAQAMDQKDFRYAKKSYVNKEIKPFIGEIEIAKAAADKKRQAKVDEIIGRRPKKSKQDETNTAKPQDNGLMDPYKALELMRKAAGYD
ncbi:integrase catalytic domain-containing protein, partial [Helicobacter suis]|uniref:integrase catalytic domain-containing protein n=1 Tax=Helicobacter suis TaxID=104628 RepID=UPI0013D447BF